MPISQDRMLALINAADDYKQALDGVLATVASIREKRIDGADYRQDLAALLELRSSAVLLIDAVQTATTVATERTHFKAHRGRNIRHAAYLRRKRSLIDTAIRTDEQQAAFEELTGQRDEVPEPTFRIAKPAKRPAAPAATYNMHDDGDPEDSAPQAQHFATRDLAETIVPNRRPFTGPDFEPPSAPSAKESHDGDE